MEIKMKDELQKWLNKHVEFVGFDKKTNNIFKKNMH